MFPFKPFGPKLLLVLSFCSIFFIVLVYRFSETGIAAHVFEILPGKKPDNYNVWLIFTKVTQTSPLQYKFSNLVTNILNVSSISLEFHVIVDNSSRGLAESLLTQVGRPTKHHFYNIEDCAQKINDIVEVMTPHFSSKPGTYYSDALFYISLGLHRIAPKSQDKALLLDCDLYFKRDIKTVFDEFDRFKPSALFGLAPELTPVYRHVLQKYKSKRNTTFGEFYHRSSMLNMTHSRGFQGYNSGVVLLNLRRIRESEEYSKVIKNDTVQYLTKKYNFLGHLGDQDFYTLLGFEYSHLIQTLNCGFNRQLCIWWKEHGYNDIFYKYFRCNHSTIILHGNCNTKIPEAANVR